MYTKVRELQNVALEKDPDYHLVRQSEVLWHVDEEKSIISTIDKR